MGDSKHFIGGVFNIPKEMIETNRKTTQEKLRSLLLICLAYSPFIQPNPSFLFHYFHYLNINILTKGQVECPELNLIKMHIGMDLLDDGGFL